MRHLPREAGYAEKKGKANGCAIDARIHDEPAQSVAAPLPKFVADRAREEKAAVADAGDHRAEQHPRKHHLRDVGGNVRTVVIGAMPRTAQSRPGREQKQNGDRVPPGGNGCKRFLRFKRWCRSDWPRSVVRMIVDGRRAMDG